MATAVAILALPGCCGILRAVCAEDPASPGRLSRDAPLDAVDYLADAFRRNAPRDVFESLDPDFVEASGGFSAADFATAWERFREDFLADAERLAAATRSEPEALADGRVRIDVSDGAMGVTLVFRNRPASRVVLADDLVPEIPGSVPALGAIVSVEGDELRVTVGAPLQGQGPFVDPSLVRRVEFHDDWLLSDVLEARNLRFVDLLREEMGGTTR